MGDDYDNPNTSQPINCNESNLETFMFKQSLISQLPIQDNIESQNETKIKFH